MQDGAAVIFMAPKLPVMCRWLMSGLSRFVTGIDLFMRQAYAGVTKCGDYTITALQIVIAATKPADIGRLSLAA
jgi:hypothetical protein